MSARRLVVGALIVILLGSAAAAYHFQGALLPWIEGKSHSDFIIVSGNIEAHESVVSFKTRAVAHRRASLRRGRAGQGGNRARPRRQVRLRSTSRDRSGEPQRPDEAARCRRAERRGRAQDRRQRRSRRCAQAARIRPRADPSDQGRGHGRGARRRGDRRSNNRERRSSATRRWKPSADRSVALAIANIESARAALEMAEITLGYTTLTAPFDGVILVRQAELGEVVSPGRGDRHPRRHRPRLAARLCQRARRRQDPARREGDGRPPTPIPGQVISGPHLLHFGGGGVHAEERRDPRRAGDARLSHPHRHRQSVARARSRPAGRRQNPRARRPASHERAGEARHRGPQSDQAVRRRGGGSAGSISIAPRARCSASSARTARARRRSCACSRR